MPFPPSHTKMVSHLQPLQPFYRWRKMNKRLQCPDMLFLYKTYKLHVSQIFQFNLTPSLKFVSPLPSTFIGQGQSLRSTLLMIFLPKLKDVEIFSSLVASQGYSLFSNSKKKVLETRLHLVVCYTAVFSVVTQRSVEERCVTTLKTAV